MKKLTILRRLAKTFRCAWRTARSTWKEPSSGPYRQFTPSDDLLAGIIEQSPTPTWISDPEGTLIKINKACLDLLRITEEEVLGLYNVFRDDLVVAQGLAPLIRRVYEEHVAVRFKIFWDASKIKSIALKDHRAVVLHTSVFPILDESGALTYAVFQHLDVTGLTRAEEEKERLQAQLLQAQKMESMGRLAGGVAHDFNNMLMVILGYTDLIKTRLTAEDSIRPEIDEIEKAAVRSKEIVGQLLAFSRKQVIEPRVMDLNSAIGQIHSALSRMIGEDIELRLETAPGLWRIRMDLTQLNQILMNMTANARDAMPNGGVLEIGTMNSHITEEYCREHAECVPGPYVCLTIRDNGIGIDEAVKSQLFEPFFTTKEMGRGTGLGLATVYGIVKQNSGFIEVDGSPGNGTCFRVLLPAAEECEAEPAEPESEDAVAEHIDARVLLVEDDSMVHRMTASMLRSIGCEVNLAENPSDALEVFKSVSGSLDLVILDVIMPGMNGARLRDLIRHVRPDMPVLFMSGYTSDIIARRGILESGVHFIQKPFGRSALSRKIREALGRE